MFLVVTRNFPPDLGGIQMLMGGLSENLLNHGPVKVFTYDHPDSKKYDWGSIAGSILISFFVAIVFYFSEKLQNLESQGISGFPEFIQPFGFVLVLGLVY